MRPKIEACRRFVATTGMPASIGSIDDARQLLFGRYGNPGHGPGSTPDRPSQGSGIQLEMTSIVNPQTPEHPAPTAVPVRVRFSSSACTAPEWGELPRRAPDRVVVNREMLITALSRREDLTAAMGWLGSLVPSKSGPEPLRLRCVAGEGDVMSSSPRRPMWQTRTCVLRRVVASSVEHLAHPLAPGCSVDPQGQPGVSGAHASRLGVNDPEHATCSGGRG